MADGPDGERGEEIDQEAQHRLKSAFSLSEDLKGSFTIHMLFIHDIQNSLDLR